MSYAQDNGHDMPREPWQFEQEVPDSFEVDFTRLVTDTPQAYLIRFDNGKKYWFPKSQCNIVENKKPEMGGVLFAPGWLLDSNGIHYDN